MDSWVEIPEPRILGGPKMTHFWGFWGPRKRGNYGYGDVMGSITGQNASRMHAQPARPGLLRPLCPIIKSRTLLPRAHFSGPQIDPSDDPTPWSMPLWPHPVHPVILCIY